MKAAVCINLLDIIARITFYVRTAACICLINIQSIDCQNWYISNFKIKSAPNQCFRFYLSCFVSRRKRDLAFFGAPITAPWYRPKKNFIWNRSLSLLHLPLTDRAAQIRVRVKMFWPNFHWNAESKVVRDYINKYVI